VTVVNWDWKRDGEAARREILWRKFSADDVTVSTVSVVADIACFADVSASLELRETIFTERISGQVIAIGRVRPSVGPFVCFLSSV